MKSSSPPASVQLSVNTILTGVWYSAGTPIPANEVPANLRAYVVKPETESDSNEPQERDLSFQLYTQYKVDERGYRYLRPEAAELNRAAEVEEAVEEAMLAPPDPVVAAAIEQAQLDRAADVAGQKAELAAKARRHDEAEEWALAEQEKTRDRLDVDGFAAPTDPADDIIQKEFVELPQQEEMPAKPKPRMRKRYVRRGNTWLRAMKVSCRSGESVYVREGKGRFAKVGVVGKGGSLPAAYLTKGES